jgi:lipoprotein-anchoring transpeptidase ErfK/SrfK
MTIQTSTRTCASFLTAASAMLWLGTAVAAPLSPSYPGNSAALFGAVMQHPAPADDMESHEAPHLQRQVVSYATSVAAGTIVIDTAQTYLYYVLGDGKAIRYGIGVGRDGFTWSGPQTVTRMAEWPDWTPPQEMIARQPYLTRWMAGGEGNPLGARAIYLGSTVYRIHGTNAPETIGTRVSSGCFRLTNADVADLYGRVTVGTKVIVLPNRIQASRTPTAAPASLVAPQSALGRAELLIASRSPRG